MRRLLRDLDHEKQMENIRLPSPWLSFRENRLRFRLPSVEWRTLERDAFWSRELSA